MKLSQICSKLARPIACDQTRSVVNVLSLVSLVSLVSLLSLVSGCAQTEGEMDHLTHKSSHQMSCDIHTTQDGRWSQNKMWSLNRSPKASERVCVHHRVKYDQTPSDAVDLRAVTVKGKLIFAVDQSTQLRVQDLHVMEGGLLRIGQRNQPLPKEHLAEIVFVHQEFESAENIHSPHELGLITMGGDVELHGRHINRILRFGLDLDQGQHRYQEDDIKRAYRQMRSAAWRAGDELLFPAMTFKRDEKLGNETRHIQALNDQVFELDHPLDYPHLRIHQEDIHVANLSANIILRSAQPEIGRRGHVMFMKGDAGRCGQVDISGVRFDHLGRTNKMRVTSESNPQMMYALHFHRCGAPQDQRSHVVRESVVVNTPGWGFVNHGSDVIFDGNVVYDFVGAGFVAEAGDERGVFSGNLSVGGDGVQHYAFRRLYLGSKERVAKADLGFHGDGFWISSPFVEVKDNASIGHHGNGFVWYLTGVDSRFVGADIRESTLSLTVSKSFLTSEELSRLGYRQPKRSWDGSSRRFLVSDLPIFPLIKGNYAAASFVGLRVRYARSLNFAFLNKFWAPQSADDYIQGLNRPSDREELYAPYSRFADMTLQNNEIGLHTSYAARLHLSGFKIEADQHLISTPTGGGRFDQNETTGIEMNHHSNWSHLLEEITVRGYEVGERTVSEGGAVGMRDVSYVDCDVDQVSWSKSEIRSHRR